MNHRFQKKLQKQIIIFTVLLIIGTIIIFSASLIYYADRSNDKKIKSAENYLVSMMNKTYNTYADNLKKSSTNLNFTNYLKSNAEEQENQHSQIYQMYYSFLKKAPVKSNLVITNIENKIVFHTFTDNRLSNQLLEFNKIINERIEKPEEIQSTTMNLYTGQNLFMMTTGVFDKDELVGYVSFYLDGDDFSYQISNQQFDGVITDRFGDIIAISNKKFIKGPLNRVNEDYQKNAFTINGVRYLSEKVPYHAQGIQIRPIVTAEDNLSLLLLGISVIAGMGSFLLMIAIYFSKQISYRMSKSVSLLCDEIEEIKKGDLDYKIELHTNDEFEIISDHINEMVEQIKILTKRNAELDYVSKISEIKQLEAQFNPHFLYNTLETIRYSILMSDGIASDMIIKLTKILRYSINEDIDQVKFKDDLLYVTTFLHLQKYRFKEHFTYEIHIEDACLDMIIPKLIIQPLIENSIKNGFKHKTTLHIHIHGKIEKNTMIICVEDDGIGILPEDLEKLNHRLQNIRNDSNHHGLFNTQRRLYLLYGEGSGISIESVYKQKTVVTLTIVLGGTYV